LAVGTHGDKKNVQLLLGRKKRPNITDKHPNHEKNPLWDQKKSVFLVAHKKKNNHKSKSPLSYSGAGRKKNDIRATDNYF
jgi:hypothetical protein